LERDLISPLRSARDKLMSYPQPQILLIPTICTACFVESLAMAMANTSPERTKQARKRYRDWLVAVSTDTSENTLQGKIRSLQLIQQADRAAANTLVNKGVSTTLCYTERHEKQLYKSGGTYGFYGNWYRCFEHKTSAVLAPKEDVWSSVTEMLNNHTLQWWEPPTGVTYQVQRRPDNSEGWVTWYDLTEKRAYTPDYCAGAGHTLACSTNEDPARAKADELSSRLTSNGLQLMSLHALKDAADKGIAFIDRLEPSLKSERPS
jgi:hypothetical protein